LGPPDQPDVGVLGKRHGIEVESREFDLAEGGVGEIDLVHPWRRRAVGEIPAIEHDLAQLACEPTTDQGALLTTGERERLKTLERENRRDRLTAVVALP
jgi:hypothetical protein